MINEQEHLATAATEDFQDYVNRLVHNRTVTVERICGEMGVSKTTVARWLSGKSVPHRLVREAPKRTFG